MDRRRHELRRSREFHDLLCPVTTESWMRDKSNLSQLLSSELVHFTQGEANRRISLGRNSERKIACASPVGPSDKAPRVQGRRFYWRFRILRCRVRVVSDLPRFLNKNYGQRDVERPQEPPPPQSPFQFIICKPVTVWRIAKQNHALSAKDTETLPAVESDGREGERTWCRAECALGDDKQASWKLATGGRTDEPWNQQEATPVKMRIVMAE